MTYINKHLFSPFLWVRNQAQLSWVPPTQDVGVSAVLLDELEDLFPSSFMWLLVRGLSTLLTMASWLPPEQVMRERKRDPQKSTKTEDAVFYNLISEVTYHYFWIFYWSYRPTLVQCGKGLHKHVNSRRRRSLRAILESGYHSVWGKNWVLSKLSLKIL